MTKKHKIIISASLGMLAAISIASTVLVYKFLGKKDINKQIDNRNSELIENPELSNEEENDNSDELNSELLNEENTAADSVDDELAEHLTMIRSTDEEIEKLKEDENLAREVLKNERENQENSETSEESSEPNSTPISRNEANSSNNTPTPSQPPRPSNSSTSAPRNRTNTTNTRRPATTFQPSDPPKPQTQTNYKYSLTKYFS
ncbi:hypothetical protein [Mycoplasma struthionis]|uniref:Uncharacterized protein n=1 Tax=Mycoplasma struthionis TaxID=538220 RepID=A0A502MIK9_9MOLU|nr:hypothetical protein [Mycoplasma struthionis]TPI01576.1 hypothetical protein FJM01_02345 [Mycoplasma struthionis]